jgi:DNA-binding MarR family transcriptional regulator
VLEYSSTKIITGDVMRDKRPLRIPNAGEGKRGEQGHLGYLLRQASAAVRQAIKQGLEDLEVTQPQFLVMTMIDAYPGSSSADVARLTMLTPQTICLIVANLERAGRLTKAASSTHGRIQRIALTPSGGELLARCKARVRRIEIKIEALLPPESEPALRRWLVELATSDLTIDPAADEGMASRARRLAR